MVYHGLCYSHSGLVDPASMPAYVAVAKQLHEQAMRWTRLDPGSGEVARRATSLGPKPSLFFWFVLFFLKKFFHSLHLLEKPVLHPRKGHFLFIFECLPLFFLSIFRPPPSSISLSLSLLFFFFFPSCLSFFAFFWFLSLSPFFLSSLLLFHERNNIKIFNCNALFHQSFLFSGFAVLFSL